MKLRLLCLTSLALTGFAQAQTSYSDDTGDITVPGNPYPHIDISGVDVTLAGNVGEEELTFKINLAGNPVTINWGKYMIAIRSSTGGATTGNGWGRPINYASGMTHWIGGWADSGGGAQVFSYSGGSWSTATALSAPVINSTSYSITVPVSLVGVTPGEAFTFDVYTSGGNGTDSAVDALSVSTPSINNWSDTFTTTAPLVFGGLNPTGDQDEDGYTNENEDNGAAPPDGLGYVSNPLIPNYTNMNVGGDFNLWSASEGPMTQGATSSLTTQYEWTYERRFATPAQSIAYKFTTNNSFIINWGQGGSAGSVARNGSDITGFIGASGIYRFFFDQGNLTQTLTRRTFGPGDSAAFLTAYGLSDINANDDGDSWTNSQELAANTDPLNADTDGDGTNDNADAEPLIQRRNITFSVNMNVQIAKGNYTVGQTVELLVFSGAMLSPNPGSGYTMTDGDADGIYTVTLSNVPGFQGQAFGNYKFFNNTSGAPNSGYEEGFDRNFNLGAPVTTQVLGTVFFSNDSTFPVEGYDDWVTGITWPEGADTSRTGNPDGDADNNLQEFLFGGSPVVANGALSTSQRDGSSLVIRYFARNEGAGYQVLENDDLAGEWTPSAGAIVSDDPDQTGVPSGHTRKLATIPISGARNFFRIKGTETAP